MLVVACRPLMHSDLRGALLAGGQGSLHLLALQVHLALLCIDSVHLVKVG